MFRIAETIQVKLLPRRSHGAVRLVAVASGLLLSACNLQKDIDVVLPAYPPQLVVEAYLENGQVPQVSVTESVPYLATPAPEVPRDVTVTLLLPNGRRDTLRFAPSINPVTRKGFTHVGRRPVVARPGEVFGLEVQDKQGRRVTGTAAMPPVVPIDTVEWKFNDRPAEQRKAYVLTRFRDPGATVDYYRLMIHDDSLSKKPALEYTVEDRLNNGQEFTLGTSYRFEANDTLLVSLYHLDPPYYRFLQSVEDARNANGNPFAQPSTIKSTVQGGLGVFTILSYQRRMVIVK